MLSKLVYIAAPYTLGDVALNVRDVVETAEELVEGGYVPFIPHLTHLWHLMSPHDYEYWIDYVTSFIPYCYGLLRLPGESPGADREIKIAKDFNIPVYYYIEDLLEENQPTNKEG